MFVSLHLFFFFCGNAGNLCHHSALKTPPTFTSWISSIFKSNKMCRRRRGTPLCSSRGLILLRSPSFIWDSPLKTFKAPCISLWTEPQSYYSCHIPCTLHSLCNDVSNNLLMLTAPRDGIFYLWLAMTQAAGVTSAREGGAGRGG